MYVHKCDSEVRMCGLTKAGVQNGVYPKRVTNPAGDTMGTGSFPGIKRPARGIDHPPRSRAFM